MIYNFYNELAAVVYMPITHSSAFEMLKQKSPDCSFNMFFEKNCTFTINSFYTLLCNLDLFQTQSILKKWRNSPRKIISTESLELIGRLVSENLGYGILPSRAANLSQLSIKSHSDLPSFKDEIYLVYRP